MKKIISFLILLFAVYSLEAQVGIGNTSPNATLEISASNPTTPNNTDGLLIPRVNAFPITNPGAAQNSMLLYLTTTVGSNTPGFYYWDNNTASWKKVGTGAEKIDDLTDGKSDNDGTDDGSSIFLGINAGINDDGTNNSNVGVGYRSLYRNIGGYNNTAIGYQTLRYNFSGYRNVAIGIFALYNNTTGYNNTASGSFALNSNTIGYANTANGHSVLYDNTTGNYNTGNGHFALSSNTLGGNNTAIGSSSLTSNTFGFNNAAIGYSSLASNISGTGNTAIGSHSLNNNINGNNNIAIGSQAGYNETGSNALYIENTNADANNALIYGEFGLDNTSAGNILRTNSEFQIGNPTLTGYTFPTTDGTANQIMQTDGTGQLSWVDNTDVGAERINDLIDGKSDNDGSEDGSSIFLGIGAGANDDGDDNRNIGIGYQTLQLNTTGMKNVAIGHRALYLHSTGNNNSAIGEAALYNNSISDNNTANGSWALFENLSGSNNTAFGRSAGYSSEGNNNVYLGYNAGYNERGSNKLYIESSNADANNALIYGEFDTNILRTNSEFQIGNPTLTGYAFPIVDGTASQIIQTDGTGQLSWVDNTNVGVERINDLIDGKSDNDGSEDGSSIFLGIGAGTNDDGTDNRNVGIGFEALNSNITGNGNVANGYQTLFSNDTGYANVANGIFALYSNTSGGNNVANGDRALYSNTSGSGNIAIGDSAGYDNNGGNNIYMGNFSGYNNINGSSNIFIGNEAGYNENGNYKLYIESYPNSPPTNANNALIYGEFDNDILRTNSEFQIGNPTITGYAFPTIDGSANRILQTDGNGQLNWVNAILSDNQNLTGATLTGNTLQIDIEDGASASVDLSSLNNGDITNVIAGTGLTGGGTTGDVTVNVIAENGLTANANNIILGGTLNQATTINQGINTLTFNLNNTGDFKIQDNGSDHFEIRDNGNTYFGGDIFFNDENSSGNPLARIYDGGSGNDGVLEVYKDALIQHQINGAGATVFNELGHDHDFKIEGNSLTELFYIDAGNDIVRIGRSDGSISGDGTTVNSTTLNYVADFELSTGGTTVGLGSAEYVADVGSNLLAFQANLLPNIDDSRDLGSSTLRWDDVYATNGTIQTSDIRDKENINEISYGLNELLELEPIRFQWKNSHDKKAKLGFSAQQLQILIPEVVKDYDYEFPEDGSAPIKKQAHRLGVYYSDLIPVVVKAIQEQQDEIELLKAENDALKSAQKDMEVRLKKLEDLIQN